MTGLYEVDAAMCGGEFNGDVAEVARYLTKHGYPSIAILDSVNGARNDPDDDEVEEPPEEIWMAALIYAEALA